MRLDERELQKLINGPDYITQEDLGTFDDNESIEDKITTEVEDEQSRKLVLCRAELASPTTDWETTWRRARLK